MSWWDSITDLRREDIFEANCFLETFPPASTSFVDERINFSFPSFDSANWEKLRRKTSRRRLSENDDATVVRWIGSDHHRMELCYSESDTWYFLCKQDDRYFSVSIINGHLYILWNDVACIGTDGSTGYGLSPKSFRDPQTTLEKMMEIAKKLMETYYSSKSKNYNSLSTSSLANSDGSHILVSQLSP